LYALAPTRPRWVLYVRVHVFSDEKVGRVRLLRSYTGQSTYLCPV
jgi:hypothetical protein